MYEFRKSADPDNPYDHTSIRMSTNTVSLDEVLETFENYLRACGFVFDGRVDIVEPEELLFPEKDLPSDDD